MDQSFGEQDKMLLHHIFYTTSRLEIASNELCKKNNLTTKQLGILAMIHHGINTNTKLQETRGGHKSTITQKLNYLEKKEFIERKLDSNDRRIWYFMLTNKGEKAIKALIPTYKEFSQSCFKNLNNKEKKDLEIILKKIQGNI